MSSPQERYFVGIRGNGEIKPFLHISRELAQYDAGLVTSIGEKALRLLDVITDPDVQTLKYTRDVIIRGKVTFKDEEVRETV